MTDTVIAELAGLVGTRAACRAVGRPQATHYRRHRRSPLPPPAPRPEPKPQPRALSATERREILDVLHSPRFCDVAPAEVWATLLDEGVYLASVSTRYRVLRDAGETRERRAQATHPARVKPELCATAPLQTWSWGITKLHGPAKWTYYYLYVIMDIYSRYVVGWMLAPKESSELPKAFIAEICAAQGIDPETLTLHADNGSSMASKPVAFLLADLGVNQDPLPAPHEQRQPLQRSAVQDDEVPARLSQTLRQHRAGPGLLPGLLRLVQPRAPSCRPGSPDPV